VLALEFCQEDGMKRYLPMSMFACLALCLALVTTAHAQEPPYVLRDTTSLPPTSAGHARLLISREGVLGQGMKPEFVFIDRKPFGMLPPKSALTAEITPGWHRIWFGRGATADTWLEVAAGGRYLLRLREDLIEDNWRSDLVLDSPEGYKDFAIGKGMKLALTTKSGYGALQRNLAKLAQPAHADSTALATAKSRAQVPIMIAEAWYRDLQGKYGPPEYEQNPGKLTLDAEALRYTRADTTVIAIPRAAITMLRYGGMKGDRYSPWLNVVFMVEGKERGAAFCDPARGKSTESYNRLFAELEKTLVVR
jgi:hypothetical protein